MSDLISRQAALDALGERPTVWTDDDDYALGERNQYDMDRLAIETVPSAQPVNIAKLQPNCNQVASDCISRQAAIKTAHLPVVDDAGYEVVRVDDILALPSTQPGWIPTSERLPDNDRAVLVTLKWAEDDYEVAVGEYWHNSTASHGWGSFEGHVIAWHELPTPYREGGQDGKN